MLLPSLTPPPVTHREDSLSFKAQNLPRNLPTSCPITENATTWAQGLHQRGGDTEGAHRPVHASMPTANHHLGACPALTAHCHWKKSGPSTQAHPCQACLPQGLAHQSCHYLAAGVPSPPRDSERPPPRMAVAPAPQAP